MSLFLGDLARSDTNTGPIDLRNRSDQSALEMLEMMITIRRSEETIADLVVAGKIKCPCHLAIGQEAPAVGVAAHLRPDDRGFGAHRSHSHYLASGGSLDGLMAEVLGKDEGASRGMGGSMHLYGEGTSFAGSVPIVAGTVPLAVGAGLASKLEGADYIGVAYFGDGACEEGIVHESLNMASVMKLPVLFVVENNLYSSHLDINYRQPFDSTARFAKAHGVAYEVVDGNDVGIVADAAGHLIKGARRGEGPGFLEAVTYRWRGHVGPDENIDVGVRRSAEEVAAWKRKDPIARLEAALVERGMDGARFAEARARVEYNISTALSKAENGTWPAERNLLEFVYA